jgi:hypothetical protein
MVARNSRGETAGLPSQSSAASFTTVPVNSAITATVTIKTPIARAGELLAGRVSRAATITTVTAAAGSNTEARPA